MNDSPSNNQQLHFNTLHTEYVSEYDDEHSKFYKRKLIYDNVASILASTQKKDLTLLEVACGSGSNLQELKMMCSPNLSVVGVDISDEAILEFETRHGSGSAFRVDFTKADMRIPGSPFDVVLILGGVHHMVNDLDNVFKNVFSNLVEDGLVIFVEPNKLFLNRLRRLWYRRSRYFESDSEEAIHHDSIALDFQNMFTVEGVKYFGGPGFFIVLQSLILHIPRWAKRTLCRPLTSVDVVVSKILPARLLPAFIAVWRKGKSNGSAGIDD